MAIHLFHRTERDVGASINLFITGVHNAHGELQLDVFNDVALLARRRPWGSKLFIFGDFNCDQLPDHAADPWQDDLCRTTAWLWRMAEFLLTLANGAKQFVITTVTSGAPT